MNLVSHKTCDFGKRNQHVVGFTEEHEEMDCRERCEKSHDCKFLFYNSAKKCVMYNSCEQYRTAATAGNTLEKIDIGTVMYFIFHQTSNVFIHMYIVMFHIQYTYIMLLVRFCL